MAKLKTVTDRILQFIAFKGISEREFAKKSRLSSTYITSLKNGAEPGINKVQNILSAYPELNNFWLFTGEGEMLKQYPATEERKPLIIQETQVPYKTKSDAVRVPVTDLKAVAGRGYLMNDFINTVQTIELPQTMVARGKVYLCVKINGPSMSPTLHDSGYLLIHLLDRNEWRKIKTGHVYVVVDVEGVAHTKRLKNHFANGGFIVLTSDNPDKATYPDFNLKEENIVSIWFADWYFSAKMPNIHDQFYSRLERLENAFEDVNRKLNEFTEPKLKK